MLFDMLLGTYQCTTNEVATEGAGETLARRRLVAGCVCCERATQPSGKVCWLSCACRRDVGPAWDDLGP